jgi:hypothetical protein
MATLEERIEALVERVSALEMENHELRQELDGAAPPAAPKRLDRRGLLRFGGAAAALGAGSVLLRANPAAAATGDNFVLGQANDADATTSLTQSASLTALLVTNSAGGEGLHVHTSNTLNNQPAIHAFDDGVGGAIFAEQNGPDPSTAPFAIVATGAGGGISATSSGPGVGVFAEGDDAGDAVEAAVFGTGNGLLAHIENTANSRRAVYAYTRGSGQAVLANIINAASSSAALRAQTSGTGIGVDGSSTKGVGGRFSGKTAQLQLVPSSSSSHPSKGSPGQFFVDHSHRLWFCRGGTSWKQLA